MSKLIQNAFSLFESGKYKKAISILDSPELIRFPAAKALKAYCAVFVDDPAIAREAIIELIPLRPTDEFQIKQAMEAIHYIGDYSLAVELLEKIHAVDKHNIFPAELLYFSYFCMRNFDKMRDLSVEMVQLFKMKQYTVWNCVNSILNDCPEDPEKNKRVLLLSEMMVKKFMTAAELKSREGRSYQWLLIEIMLMEGKYEAVEKEIEERMKTYVVSQKLLDERILQQNVLQHLGRELEIVALLENDMVTGLKADWDTISYYVKTVQKLIPKESVISHLTEFCSTFCNCPNNEGNVVETREKFLLKLEIASICIKEGNYGMTKFATLLTQYVTFIGHKSCCFCDLERWLPYIASSDESISVITSYILSCLGLTINVSKGTDLLNNVQKKVTCIEIAIALHISINVTYLSELYHIYTSMISQYSETIATKEILSFDYIPLLLAEMLNSKGMKIGGAEGFRDRCEAIAILEDNLRERPHFFRSSLALCMQYYSMGVPMLSVSHYEELDIKEIHMMSMSYPLEHVTREWGLVKETKDRTHLLHRFIIDGLKQTYVKRFQCVKEQAYQNIKSIGNLADRLSNSREYHAFLISYYLNVLVTSITNYDVLKTPEFDTILSPLPAHLVDNADYDYSRFWPVPQSQQNMLTECSGVSTLLVYHHAVAALFVSSELRNTKQEFNHDRVSAVHVAFAALQASHAVSSLLLHSYAVFDIVLTTLESDVIDEKAVLAEVVPLLLLMEQEASFMRVDGMVSAEVLSQLSQVARQVLVWTALILGKNKKINKPAMAKLPKDVIMTEVIASLLQFLIISLMTQISRFFNIPKILGNSGEE